MKNKIQTLTKINNKLIVFSLTIVLACWFGINSATATKWHTPTKQGPKGDKGDKGDRGHKGDKGDRGHKGDKGDRGHAGKNGRDGKDGKNGSNGRDGKDGSKGDRGQAGKDGKNGRDGLSGGDSSVGDTSSISSSSSFSNANSSSNNKLEDVGNNSGNNSDQDQSLNITYPLTINPAELISAQQCSGVYDRYNGVSLDIKGIKVTFITDAYAEVAAIAARTATPIGDSFASGKPHFVAKLINLGKFKQPIALAKRIVKRAPRGTNSILAHINTDCNTTSAGLSVGRGGVSQTGKTGVASASYGSASNVPYAQLYPVYFADIVTIDDCAVKMCKVD